MGARKASSAARPRRRKSAGKRTVKHFRGFIARRAMRVENGEVFRIKSRFYFIATRHLKIRPFGTGLFIEIPLFLANLLGLQHGVHLREE
jgi:hypothetical protein